MSKKIDLLRYFNNLVFLTLFASLIPTYVQAAYENPFKIIPTSGDDLSKIYPKPEVVYEEVSESKIEIPNMPAIKSQDDLGECRAFSMTTLIQKFYCDHSTPAIEDCKNPPRLKHISSFGMMSYTNSRESKNISYEYLQTDQDSVYSILNRIKNGSNRFILDACKPFDQFINNLNSSKDRIKQRDDFFAYLKEIYSSKQAKTEAEVAECPECLSRITAETGISEDLINLKDALTMKSYDEFLYVLFFDGCGHVSLRPGFNIEAYPDYYTPTTEADIKNKIIEGLKKGNPVLFPHLCTVDKYDGDTCPAGHSLVISGYKKACHKNTCKDIFKVHNSWGEEWQKMNNDGWLDADQIVNNTMKANREGKFVIPTNSVIWLEKVGK